MRSKHNIAVILAIALSLASAPTAAYAQGAPVSSILWNKNLKPVVLGQGIRLSPNEIAVKNLSVALSDWKWQYKKTDFTKLDYTNTAETMTSNHVNAWAEYDGMFAGGSTSFDWKSTTAFQSNHRIWEVDATRYYTAAISAPNLTTAAQKYYKNVTAFEGLYGNYAVTGIT